MYIQSCRKTLKGSFFIFLVGMALVGCTEKVAKTLPEKTVDIIPEKTVKTTVNENVENHTNIFPNIVDIPRLPETTKADTLYITKNGFGDIMYIVEEVVKKGNETELEADIANAYASYMRTTDWVNESVLHFKVFSKRHLDGCRFFSGIVESSEMNNPNIPQSKYEKSIYLSLAIDEKCDRSSIEKTLTRQYKNTENHVKGAITAEDYYNKLQEK